MLGQGSFTVPNEIFLVFFRRITEVVSFAASNVELYHANSFVRETQSNELVVDLVGMTGTNITLKKKSLSFTPPL